MTAAMAIPGNTADAFLVHFFGDALADDRYVVERFRALADRDIRPCHAEAPGEGQGPQGEARHRHAEGGGGTVPRPPRDHHLHGYAHRRRLAALGFGRSRNPLRLQTARLNRVLPGRPAGTPPRYWIDIEPTL